MPQQDVIGPAVLGPALRLARTVLGQTQQQAGVTIGLGAIAAKNVFALYERGDRMPRAERLSSVVNYIHHATFAAERFRTPPANGLAAAPIPQLEDVDIGEVAELTHA